MRIGAFELPEPVPDLNEPYAFACLRPWVDVNNVGTLVLNELEAQFGADDLGELARPGHFFDFTRYRPTLHIEEGIRNLSIPNVTVRYARSEGRNDFLFLHLLEPHAQAERYVDSILMLLTRFRVKKYILLGSMYDMVPHTRSLIVNGWAMGREALKDLDKSGAASRSYQGPTTITTLIRKRAPEFGIDAVWFIVALPQYVALDEDYAGKVRLMEILNSVYDIPIEKGDYEKAAEQRKVISQNMERTPEFASFVTKLEIMYEARVESAHGEGTAKLTPEMEGILWGIMGKKDIGEA
jgi:predicted ATP-grasp superfamily ATP-dependent carboligase